MKNERGFTLIELLVAITISTVLLMALDKYVLTGIEGANQDYNQSIVLSNAKTAVAAISREIESSVAVEAENAQPDNNAPGAPSNLYSWSGAAGNGGNLILAVPARNSSDSIMYIDGNHTQIYTNDVIYYLDPTSHKLYRRIVANPTAQALGDVAISTCPPAEASSTCPADADVVDDVANLVTNYLDGNGNSISLPSGTEAVSYTVTETKTINGKTIAGTYTTVADLRNR